MQERKKSGKASMKRCAGWMLIPVLLTSGCDQKAVFATETEATICRELRVDLPTYSSRDTEESKTIGDRYLTRFNAVCPE